MFGRQLALLSYSQTRYIGIVGTRYNGLMGVKDVSGILNIRYKELVQEYVYQLHSNTASLSPLQSYQANLT